MKTEKVPAKDFKKTIKMIVADYPRPIVPNGRAVGMELKKMGFLTMKDIIKNKIKPGNCAKFEVTIGRGKAVFTNLKLAANE